jgi:hypothetical protein
MESTCRPYQVRFKRPGQFWSQAGDEALMCLETFRRNGRGHLLFPHAQDQDPFQKLICTHCAGSHEIRHCLPVSILLKLSIHAETVEQLCR